MATYPVDRPWEVVFSGADGSLLFRHLFRGDDLEHAAVLLAGVHILPTKVRLLVKEVALAVDGVDHVRGGRGYLTLRGQFVHQYITKARQSGLVYLSVHNHSGKHSVNFSSVDLDAHERGYPALLDLAQGLPVGALVFAEAAIAGDIWLPDGRRVEIDRGHIISTNRTTLTPNPLAKPTAFSQCYQRQVLLFGASGQAAISEMKVGIIGLGGIGSLLAELLARLGVNDFVLIDKDRADKTNLPRLIASRRWDAVLDDRVFGKISVLQPLLNKLRRRKIDLAARNIRRANPHAKVRRVFAAVEESAAVHHLLDRDFIFLAADTMIARLIFNALVQQYLIPGVQVGARVVASDNGSVSDVYAVCRSVFPRSGCLLCNGLINRTKLQMETTDPSQAAQQHYGTGVPAPSVISLNAVSAADAVCLFQFHVTGLMRSELAGYRRVRPLYREAVTDEAGWRPDCPECGSIPRARFGQGTNVQLPTR